MREQLPWGRWLKNARLASRLTLTLAVGMVAAACSESPEVKAERLRSAPEAACRALYEYTASSAMDPDQQSKKDALRSAQTDLDGATDEDAIAIQRYLQHERGDSRALAETGDLGATDPYTGHALLVQATQSCRNLGYPEAADYLYAETRNQDYAP